MLSKEHQLFLQHLMRRKLVSSGDILAMISSCKKAFNLPAAVETDVDGYIRAVNDTVKHFNMQIYKGADEEDGKIYYALVNIVDSSLSRTAAAFHKKQHLEYFKKLICAVMDAEDGLLSTTAAVNLVHDLPPASKVTVAEAEKLLEDWNREKYFSMTSDETRIYFGVKFVIEFRQYLQKHFASSIETCNLCRVLCIRGIHCPGCSSKFHFHCAQTCLDRSSKCPQCSNKWSSDLLFR